MKNIPSKECYNQEDAIIWLTLSSVFSQLTAHRTLALVYLTSCVSIEAKKPLTMPIERVKY